MSIPDGIDDQAFILRQIFSELEIHERLLDHIYTELVISNKLAKRPWWDKFFGIGI